jgi:NAD(P)-dependent dehydrogenase (short-subunit alcohol dehydrogenase family)
VIILSLSKEVVEKARDAVREELGDDKAKRTQWIQIDLSDWDKIPQVAEEIKKSTSRLDILVNNAGRGIMTAQQTEYGVDRHMALNHFGHAILTAHLLPLMKQTASQGHTVRISTQASNAHQQAPKDTDFASLESINQDVGPMPQYGRSKLANILYSRWLARMLAKDHPKILVNATHPGVVSTQMSTRDIHEPYPLAGFGMSVAMEPFKKDQFEGALSTL